MASSKRKLKAVVVRQERDEWMTITDYAFIPVKPRKKRRKRKAKR